MTELNHKITLRVNKKEWESFKKQAKKYNMPASQLIRHFMDSFKEGRVEITDLFEES